MSDTPRTDALCRVMANQIGVTCTTDHIEAFVRLSSIMERELADARAERDGLLEELRIISNARPPQWESDMRDQFQQWAQSRARAAIDAAMKDAK